MDNEFSELIKNFESVVSWGGITITSVENKNIFGDTMLHTASGWGDLVLVKLLVRLGADINAKGEIGNTPLFYACSSGGAEVVEYLLKNGADPMKKNDWGDTAKSYSICASQEIIDLLNKKMGTHVPPAKLKKKKEKGDKYTKQGKRR